MVYFEPADSIKIGDSITVRYTHIVADIFDSNDILTAKIIHYLAENQVALVIEETNNLLIKVLCTTNEGMPIFGYVSRAFITNL